MCRIQYDLQTLNQGCHSPKASILPEASHCLHAGAQEQISLLCQTCCGTLEIPKAASPQVQPESPHTEQAALTFGKMVTYVEPRPPLLCPIRPPRREQMDSIYKTTQSHTRFNPFSPVDIQGIFKSVSVILTKKKNEFAL